MITSIDLRATIKKRREILGELNKIGYIAKKSIGVITEPWSKPLTRTGSEKESNTRT